MTHSNPLTSSLTPSLALSVSLPTTCRVVRKHIYMHPFQTHLVVQVYPLQVVGSLTHSRTHSLTRPLTLIQSIPPSRYVALSPPPLTPPCLCRCVAQARGPTPTTTSTRKLSLTPAQTSSKLTTAHMISTTPRDMSRP